MTSDGEPFIRVKYKSIIKEQVLLGYLTKGGVTYGDTEEMTPNERKLALDAITEILQSQKEAQEKAINEAKANQSKKSPVDPKTGYTSGVQLRR